MMLFMNKLFCFKYEISSDGDKKKEGLAILIEAPLTIKGCTSVH